MSLAGWRDPVTHGLYGYCALVHHTMCSTQNLDWASMDRWKHSLCLYWHVLAHCCWPWHWRGLSTWWVTWTQELAMSQAKLQITASTSETFFATCNSPSIKEVEWQKELGFSIRANTNYLQNGCTIHIYIKQTVKPFTAPCGARSGSPQWMLQAKW